MRFFEKALNEIVPEKNTCVSFVREEGDKGPLAKDPRKEDAERVARGTITNTAALRYNPLSVR